ncbi:winged helix-turn-helix domain-containing protein [Bradyrhizobium sp. AUGA SZCCT0177]|uniref:winged helix-turn-helix domain-containing tetratricopeptide repeat protein n=1 Tax=Bradyrhizobium sp. AUGA SZCCT0177 TaxID=2807665 RepID=UPI001BAC6728|nr:winged helix-turn-helix domain-containing protein [Bradyrhizobium sp. AUGA SZCCT0177]MBR1286831.1 winged helix-turn-helix domain-containing protein [Bradyrhizobium sp. AUGA SZCCT0177]
MRYLFEVYTFDTERRELHRRADAVSITPQVFDLLEYLIRNRERVVSRDDLINAVWNGRIVSDAALTTRLNAARNAIGDSGDKQRLIKTLPRKGFRFVGAVQEGQTLATASASSAPNDGATQRSFSPPHLSIVVLPFSNLSGDPEQDYFVDGVTESLTTDLSRIRGTFVIGRHTAFTYKGAVDLKQIGRDLNVRYVLEGSVRRGQNRLRVNVQLVDAETRTHLWTDQFDKPVTDLFEMQDEVTARIAPALNAPLIEAEAQRGQRSLHPDALDFYFQGQHYLNQGVTPKYIALARRFFEQALALDPENIAALVGIANVELQDVTNFMVDDDRGSRLAQVEATLIKVLSAAPRHAFAHLILAGLQLFTNRATLAVRECEQALELDRNLAYAHAFLGFAKVFIGRGAESEAHIQQALHLSPRDINAHRWMYLLGVVKLILGVDTEAVEWLRRSLEANRNYPFAHFQFAAALALVGSVEEARAAALAGFALDPDFTIRRTRGLSLSSDPIFRAGSNRIRQGMLMAGIPDE